MAIKYMILDKLEKCLKHKNSTVQLNYSKKKLT